MNGSASMEQLHISLWDQFVAQLAGTLNTGYNLSLTLQTQAVNIADDAIQKWKVKLAEDSVESGQVVTFLELRPITFSSGVNVAAQSTWSTTEYSGTSEQNELPRDVANISDNLPDDTTLPAFDAEVKNTITSEHAEVEDIITSKHAEVVDIFTSEHAEVKDIITSEHAEVEDIITSEHAEVEDSITSEHAEGDNGWSGVKQECDSIVVKSECDQPSDVEVTKVMRKKKGKKKRRKVQNEQDERLEKKQDREVEKQDQSVKKKKPYVHEKGEFPCDVCGKNYSTKNSLKTHQKIHTDGPRKCSDCDKEFQSYAGLHLHRKKNHEPSSAHKCPHCDFFAPNDSTLKRHMFKHHKSLKQILCHKCDGRFGTVWHFQQHLATHDKERTLNCPHCEYKAHAERRLKNHIKNVHEQRAGFSCDICGLTLKYKNSLNLHRLKHLGENPYPCPICPHTAVSASLLAKHRRKHNQEQTRNHQCDMCKKTFLTKAHLNRHQVIHTGRKDFVCSLCLFSCNVRTNLQKHMKQAHNMTVSPTRFVTRITQVTP